MTEVFATILVVIAVSLVVVVVILVVVASIGVVIAVFAKNKGLQFEIFLQKFKKGIFSAFSRFLHLFYKSTFQILQICCSFADILSQTL